MQVREAIAALYKLDMDADICMYLETKPDDINIYAWAWICDKMSSSMLRKFDNVFSDAINSLKEAYPYEVKVASGDVVFVEKK